MNRFIPLLALSMSLAAAAAQAQTTAAPAPAPAAPAASAPAAPPAGSASTMPKPAHHHRMSLEDKFAKANTTNDGKLTLDQAKTGFKYVAKHFDAIDTGKKGYVTVDDIKTFSAAQPHGHHHVMKKPAATTAS